MKPRKLTNDQVAEIQQLAKTQMKKIDIARKFGISPQLISTIVRYGYTSRPTRERKPKADPSMNTWVDLAKAWNTKYPDERMSAAEIKSVHDLALKKIRMYFEKHELGMNDLL